MEILKAAVFFAAVIFVGDAGDWLLANDDGQAWGVEADWDRWVWLLCIHVVTTVQVSGNW